VDVDVSDPPEVSLTPVDLPRSGPSRLRRVQDAVGRAARSAGDDDRPVHRGMARLSVLEPLAAAAFAVDVVVVVAAVIFVLAQLDPQLLVADTTPAGGDMGAHVWGPAFLRDELLPRGRLAGWTPDWYAGFPAYHFYMVVPALLIVALDAGWEGWAALLPLAVALGLLAVAVLHRGRTDATPTPVWLLGASIRLPLADAAARLKARRVRRLAVTGALVVAVLGCGLPYGVAFKWVSVAGLLALPVACYVMTRLADVPFPAPALAAVASVVFLFNREPLEGGTGTIIGGNVSSTLAGEFSFSLSLLLCVLYLGFLLRGLRTGGYRATCAALLGLTALCHVIPAIYAAGATLVALLVTVPWDRARLRWFAPIAPVAFAVSAFWTVPFALRRGYLNDMGWEKLPSQGQSYGDYLWPGAFARTVLMLAVVGAVVSLVLRIRLGVFLTLCAAGSAIAFVVAPQGRLWNARLLPFYLLCICLLAGLALAELGRAIGSLLATRPELSITPVSLGMPLVAALAAWVAVGLPMGVLPGVDREIDDTGGYDYEWIGLRVGNAQRSPVRDWARWNYTGFERKAAFPEYHDLIAMGQRIAADPQLGCGRVMWEYEQARLNSYGTPMSPMLLPFWTDGCIGSMEGLYFEASSTTPYHFLNQRALSANCSCAQRDLPYGAGFDIDLGIAQLQRMGVRYYFASTTTAIAAADAHADLTLVDRTGPWRAYLVEGSDLVEPLAFEPAVIEGLEPGMSWVGPATKWWQDPARWDVALAEDGPDAWQRVDACTAPAPDKPDGGGPDAPTWTRIDACTIPETRALPANEVTAIEAGTDRIAFDVSAVGVPVVVKASYFPNWNVSGAEGPFRLTPNHMVVIPTDTHVELSYGWTSLDVGSYALSGLGILGVVGLAVRPRRRPLDETDLWLDGPDPIIPLPPASPRPASPRPAAADDAVDDAVDVSPPLAR